MRCRSMKFREIVSIVTIRLRVLFRQWELAFRIADANRARGARPASFRTMVRRWWDYLRANR